MAEKAWKKARAAFIKEIGEGALSDPNVAKARSSEIFVEIDSDGNGKIDQTELKAAMEKLGVLLTNKEVEDMMREADEDGCAAIPCPLAEASRAWMRRSPPLPSRSRLCAVAVCRVPRSCRSDMHIDKEEFASLVAVEIRNWKGSKACVVL